MLPEIERLLVVQDRDQKLLRLKRELAAAPRERAGLEQQAAASAARLESVRNQLRTAEVERKRLEVEAQAKRDSIAKFRTQQFQTRKNEEFQALGNEITRYEKEISAIEDRELELMEAQETLRKDATEAEKAHKEESAAVARRLADLDAKQEALAAQVTQVSEERAQLVAGLDEDLLYRYERLLTTKGDAAVVPLEHEVCMGCHMKITTQAAVRVKAQQEVVHCEQCGRILYRGD
jgi:predicted  nucleic acid-binding Zn-ribbon protein